jgi:phosphoserine phosphatase
MVLFDMDGVLVDSNSSWHHVHTYFKTNNDDSVEAYVKGRISDEEFIRRDVSQWKNEDKYILKKELETIFSTIKLMHGAKTCIQQLTDLGIIVGIVSAGIDVLADKVASLLDIHLVYANQLVTDDSGRLTGEGIVNVPLMHKDKVVERISKEYAIAQNRIAAVGNSCFDIPLLRSVGLGFAFHPDDDCIIEEADIVIYEKDLGNVFSHLEPYI